MSEEQDASIEQEEPQTLQDESKLDDIIIQIQNDESIEDNPTIKALTKELQTMKQQLAQERAEKEQQLKAQYLTQLESAGYNPNSFSSLDHNSLKVVLEGLATNNDKIVVPRKPKEREELERETRPQWFNPETGKFEVHPAYLNPEERRS